MQPLEEYEALMADKNAQLQKAGHSPLIIEEVIAARLYTGPMFEPYNFVLSLVPNRSCFWLNHHIKAYQKKIAVYKKRVGTF